MAINRDYSILLTVRADLQGALGNIKQLDSAIGGLKNTALKIAGAFGIGFSVAGLVDLVKQTIDANEALGNVSKTLGISTESLSALEQEAKKAGLSLEDVQTGLVALSKGATGQNAEGAKALAAMGINAKDAAGNIKPLSQLLQETATKFAGYQDGTAKAALATALFGRGGAQLIPLLDQVGTQGLDKITRKAVAAGTALSEAAVKASQEFGAALDDLGDKLHGAVSEAFVQFLPEIQALAKEIADPDFKQGLADIASGIVGIAKSAEDSVTSLSEFLKQLAGVQNFAQNGFIGGDLAHGVALQQLDVLTAEQKRRQAEGTLSGDFRRGAGIAGSFAGSVFPALSLASLGDQPPAVGLIGQAEAAQALTLSDKELADQIADLSKKTGDYTTKRTDANKADAAAAQKKALSDAAGSFIDGILAPSKNQAPPLGGADKGADTAKAAAAALQQLQNTLQSLRTQGLDPTQTAWAQYNKTVEDALATAQKAGNTPQAKVIADQIVQEAARIRDAKLDEIAKQDQQAWDELRKSFETPVEAHIDDALQQIKQLDDLLKKGTITAQQYQDALKQIGQHAVTDLPQYQGADNSESGAYGELQKNFEAQQELEKAYQDQLLAQKDTFRGTDEAHEAAYQAALAKLQADYAVRSTNIERSRQQLITQASEQFFGDLATLSSSSNRKIAAIGKAAAIAQTIIKTYQSATEAYASLAGIPYIGPELGIAAAAAAIAAGLANVAAIRSQSVGGYSQGGYTGHGRAQEPAGIVHKGEVVFSQRDVARMGGVNIVEAVRTGSLTGFADGGIVGIPISPGLAPDASLSRSLALSRTTLAANSEASSREQSLHLNLVMVHDQEEAAEAIARTRTFEKAVLVQIGNHPNAIQAKWRS